MAKLKVYSDIVDEESKAFLAWNGLDSMAFSDIDKFLGDIPAEDGDIELTINCRGGLTDTALAMYDALRASGKTISAEVIGECSSSATLLLLAARKDLRRAHPNASILIHNPYISGFVEGDAKRIGNIADSLADVRDRFLDIYVERTGADREVLSALMDEDKPMNVAKAIELGFVAEEILPISAKSKNQHKQTENMNIRKRIIDALANALGVYDMTIETADGKTLELEKESGEPIVGDAVVSEDGEYLLPDGRTVVVEGGVITEIRPAEEEAVEAEAERGEETQAAEDAPDEKDAEIDRLKAELAEKDAEIEELKRQLEQANANAKSESESEILDMVAVAGGRAWLDTVRSHGGVEPRETATSNMDKAKDKAETRPMTFAEYRKAKAERKKQTK